MTNGTNVTTAEEPVIGAALECMNDGDAERLSSLFAPDGTVIHEADHHHGAREIAAWFSQLPSVVIRPLRSLVRGTEHIIDAEVDGVSPDGSEPYQFRFVVAEHQIRSMSVNVLR